MICPESAQPAPQASNINIPEYVDEWDGYFSWMAKVVSIKSKDPRCRVGAVIVSQDKIVLSTGFNGLPRGVEDERGILDNVDEKLKVICHAEQKAILNAARMGISVRGASIYVTKFPCLACCNSIIQAGVERIYTLDKWYWDDDPFDGKTDETKHRDGDRRKRSALRQTHIIVDAPNHPDYRTTNPSKKPPMRATSSEPKRENAARENDSV
jgi:dCMP deaminase